ncbi:hypothetical protein Efla_002226 [Eimeria flavescens]
MSADPPRLSSAQRAVLHAAHECGALLFGSFKLKNGRDSPFFFDVGKFRDGRCMQLLAEAFAACIYENKLKYDVIFGPAYKGIPLASCTALMLASRYGQQAPFLYDRKEEKDHGEGGSLVGALELLQSHQQQQQQEEEEGPPPRVVVIDDVLTSGTALKSSLKKIRDVNQRAELVALIVLLDRQEKQNASELLAAEAVAQEFNTRVLSILQVDHLLTFLDELLEGEDEEEQKQQIKQHKEALLQHRRIYGKHAD